MTDTQDEIVVAPTVIGVAPNTVHRIWAVPLAVIGLTTLVVIALATLLTASRFSSIVRPYARVPSDAEEAAGRINFEGVERFRADGGFQFVTIRNPQLSLLSWFMFRDENAIVPLTYEDIYGTNTPQQLQVRGQRQMIGAQQAAEFAALSKLGFPIDLVQGEIVIDQIVCFEVGDSGECVEEAPSGEVLQADDELVSIDGQDITVVDDLAPILARHEPGDVVEVKYNRPGFDEVQVGQIELSASPDDPERVIVGFYPFDTTTVGAAPFPITYSTDQIGGPSAGLAFTLTIIDELTPGELSGGQRVAVTGGIDINGDVSAIGGLAQKASAVMQTGTEYFLVPASQSEDSLAEARAVVGDRVEIIPVATLDEALQALTKLGGNADEIGQPGKGFQPA